MRWLVVRGLVPGEGALAFVRRNSLVWGLFDLPDPAGAENRIGPLPEQVRPNGYVEDGETPADMLRTDYAIFHALACDADLLGPGGGAHDPQPAARLGKRDDLLFEPCLDLRPVIFQRGQLFAQLLLADIFCARLFQPDFGEIGARIEFQRIFFRFGQFGPCGDGPFDVEAGDVAVEELLV